MTKIPFLQLSLLALIALGITPSVVSSNKIQGKAIPSQKREIKTLNLMNELSQKKLTRSTCPPPAACPPCPPINPGTYAPTPNPNALPGAFFPASTTTNSLASPPQTKGLVFTAGDRATLSGSQWRQGNYGGVAGLEQFIFISNYGLLSFDRDGNRDGNLDIELASFTNADSDFSTFLESLEIRMRFDQFTNRFIFACDSFDNNSQLAGPGGFTVGISDASGVINADTTWTILNIFDATMLPNTIGCPGDQTNFIDYVRVAVDQNAIYVAANWFALDDGSFSSASAYVIQKQSLINGGPAVVTAFPDIIGFPGDPYPYREAASSLMVVDNFDNNPQFGYLIGQDVQFFGKLILYRISNPGSTTPSLSAEIGLDVPQTGMFISGAASAPFNGNLFGILGTLQIGDDILQQAHVRNGQLYTAQNILVDQNGIGTNSGDRCAIRWYQINMNPSGTETATTTPVLVQAGTLWDASASNPIWYYMPSIMTDKNGNLVIGGTLSSNVLPTTAFYVGRLANDTLGQLRIGASLADRSIAQGTGTYSRTLGRWSAALSDAVTTFSQRFGDWSDSQLDPIDNTTIWTTQSILVNGLETFVVAQLLAP